VVRVTSSPPAPPRLSAVSWPAVLFVGALCAGAPGCGPDNLAVGKPVRVSSVRLGDPAGAVNGLVEWGSIAVHTRTDSPAWLVIDLQGTHSIGEVRLFNRGDGYYDERSAQIAVEVAPDGGGYRRVGACREIFTQAAPCVVDIGGAPARYVRLVHRSHLVLSEVEVIEAQ
jgi:hypothetical protein